MNRPDFQKFAVLIIILFTVAILLDLTRFSSYIAVPIQSLFRPTQIAFQKTGNDFSDLLATISQIKGLRQREKELTLENKTLLAENATFKKLAGENKALRDQLGAGLAKEDLVLAKVIGQDPSLVNSRVLLDKGTGSGVEKNQAVVIKKILLGKISATGQNSSTLTWLTDPDMKVPGYTQVGVKGFLEGKFGNQLVFSQVANDKILKEEELIFSSGDSGFPKDFVLGKIKTIKKNPAKLFQEIQVEPMVNYDSLETVFILRALR